MLVTIPLPKGWIVEPLTPADLDALRLLVVSKTKRSIERSRPEDEYGEIVRRILEASSAMAAKAVVTHLEPVDATRTEGRQSWSGRYFHQVPTELEVRWNKAACRRSERLGGAGAALGCAK